VQTLQPSQKPLLVSLRATKRRISFSTVLKKLSPAPNRRSVGNELEQKIHDRTAKVGVIGLGYVGLPLAIEMAKVDFEVTDIDID
jgi:hypothetical protein